MAEDLGATEEKRSSPGGRSRTATSRARLTADGQLTLNGGALLGPPALGLLADVAGYDPAWLALGVAALIATGLLASVERRVRRG